jgi:hypothetical protein
MDAKMGLGMVLQSDTGAQTYVETILVWKFRVYLFGSQRKVETDF